MITFEDLKKFSSIPTNEFTIKRKDSLNENYAREIEAKIDRAIMLTRMSNPEKAEIIISLNPEYSETLIQHVLAKYEKEGYTASILTQNESHDLEVVINWKLLVNRQLAKIEGKDTLTEADFGWLENFDADSWDRAIYFADKCFRGTEDEQEEMSEAAAIVVVENIVDAFLIKLFGTENTKLAGLLGTLIINELQDAYTKDATVPTGAITSKQIINETLTKLQNLSTNK